MERLAENTARTANWKRWGPYLSERQWATIREDYSPDGACWDYFPHDHARSRAYRWGEDGLLGITDRECRLCFALAMWNGKDPILKERLFGLTGPEGNHGEDVKEEYFYLDATPTYSYMKAVYKYPHNEFPYNLLVEENRRRGLNEPEFELVDTGIFDEGRYFDVVAEYAKAGPDDLLIQITVTNRGPDSAILHLLPTLWFRNTWLWGCKHEGCSLKPSIKLPMPGLLSCSHETLKEFSLKMGDDPNGNPPKILFTENQTNYERLFGISNLTPYVKDAFHRHVIQGDHTAINPKGYGTKAAAYYLLKLMSGQSQTINLRLAAGNGTDLDVSKKYFDETFKKRIYEAEKFYDGVIPDHLTGDARSISRQAYAGLLWNKQFYHYIVKDWLEGDSEMPTPPENRKLVRNAEWMHLFNRDILSVPDKWEYPWFAAWDTAFHMIPLAKIDPQFAKDQLLLLLREWYMHPNGQIPAYEFAFGDVNPPVHAWACWCVYKIGAQQGHTDRDFLERTFQKLLLNFTWWVNRKDKYGRNLFSGGFLGLDNIGVFDRSRPLPSGGELQQADGTAWMGFYSPIMMVIAMELVHDSDKLRVVYGDMASKFFEHFIQICDAVNNLGGMGLWDEQDGFYYDQMRIDGGYPVNLKVRSLVGLLPLVAVTVLEQDTLDKLPGFKKRFDWFLENRKDLTKNISWTERDCCPGHHRWLLAIPSREKLIRVLGYLLDESEFLSPYGIRPLSKYHQDNPYVLKMDGQEFRVEYMPGESDTGLFGGNSNWRGPIWFPVNYLIVEALEKYHHYYGDNLKVECPTGSGQYCTLQEVANDILQRLCKLFMPNKAGLRPCHGDNPECRENILFHEYFDAETGKGLGANHQTGWTALITAIIENSKFLSMKDIGIFHGEEDKTKAKRNASL